MHLSKPRFIATFCLIAFCPTIAHALPIGFGVNQGSLKYSEIRNDDFIIYHDERTPAEGRMAINSLIAAKPYLENWMDVKRTRVLPVVMSAVSDNASFANFITDSIELQTLGQGTRDLYWHEYVHSTMYRHLDNWFGPAGSVIYLPWMPAWFIEGLAESLSVSVGSDVQAGIERHQALTGEWPSYDRLHSLYGKNTFALRGYATSGSFVSWMFRKTNPNRLPDLLKSFYKYSQPWWWPLAAVPFNGFMPMDESLREFAGGKGKELYSRYITEATAYWKERTKDQIQLRVNGPKTPFSNSSSMYADGNEIRLGIKRDGGFYNATMKFDEKTGWAKGWDAKEQDRLPDTMESWARVSKTQLKANVIGEKSPTEPTKNIIRIEKTGLKRALLLNRGTAFVTSIWNNDSEVIWHEVDLEVTRLCTFDTALRKVVKTPECTNFTMPITLEYLGAKPDSKNDTSEIWFNLKEQTLLGDRHQIGVYETSTRKWRKFHLEHGGQPVSVGFANGEARMITAGRSQRSIRHYSDTGSCLSESIIADLPLKVFGLNSGNFVVALYSSNATVLRQFSKSELTPAACQNSDEHSSPILAAVRAGAKDQNKIDLRTAFAASDTWNQPEAANSAVESKISANEEALDQTSNENPRNKIKNAKAAAWRGRPVLAFPWIGADDALGPQIGAVSVPLMDHMQNETVRLTMLYGVYSRYPNTELSLITNRFTPTISLSAFRQQTYNGQFIRRSDNEIVTSYLDDRGVRLGASQAFQWSASSLVLDGGWKYAKMTPYIGPTTVRKGGLSEPYLNLSHTLRFTKLSWFNSVSGRAAPPKLNKEFDYNVLGASTTVRYPLPILNSRLDLGLEGSRTRGPKRRELQELYRPLKTFIAGTGGGYNQNSFLIYGEGELFSPRFSNTQGRAKIDWSFPVIDDIDKLLWIFYIDRLDFTAFYNYGGAWRSDGGKLPTSQQLIGAHGYNLDLSLDNKGVRFNAGIGTGQVVKKSWQVYGTLGFDALF